MQLAKYNISAVSSQHFRLSLLNPTQLIRVTQYKLTCFERCFFGIRSGNAASFDRGMTYSVTKAKRLFLVRQGMAVLTPDRFDSFHLLVSVSRASETGFELRFIRRERHEYNVNVRSSEWFIP